MKKLGNHLKNGSKVVSPYFETKAEGMEKEGERYSDLFSEFAFRSESQSEKKVIRQFNFPKIGLEGQRSKMISPCFQKRKTLECNSNRIIAHDVEKTLKEDERNSETQLEIESTVKKEKNKRVASDYISNSQRKVSPYFQKAVKQEQRNAPNEIDKEKSGERKRKGYHVLEYFKGEVKKASLQNAKVNDQKMKIEEPASTGNSNSQRKVSPYFQKAARKEGDSNSQRKVSPYFQMAARKEGDSNSQTKVSPYFQMAARKEGDSNSQRKVSPYFQKAARKEGDSNSQMKVSPYFQKAARKEEEEEKKTSVGNASMEDGKMKLPKKKRRATAVRVVSPYFPINEEDAQRKPPTIYFNKLNCAYKRKTPDNNWKPPRSPFHLLQEDHWHDPWRVMIICMLLNCTTGMQVRRVICDLFALCPDAKTATAVPTEMIEKVIETLGLQKKRAVMIQRFSSEYLDESWTYVTQLHGIGKYAADAYAIFCSGDWGLVVPRDHMLVKYWRYLFTVISYYGLKKLGAHEWSESKSHSHVWY